MATSTAVVTTKPALTPSPYQVDIEQTLRASKALLTHVQHEAKRIHEQSSKRSLLAVSNDDADEDEEDDTPIEAQPIWLSLTTKQHIVDKARLKPSKIKVPHPLNTSTSLNICLISADPQRGLKDIVADPSFPKSLSSRITKVIGFSKLKDRYKSFESRRQLLAEHDIFLADDRIISRLVNTLGKTFYHGTTKRPIPISISFQDRVDGKRQKPEPRKAKEASSAKYASVSHVAKEISTAITCVPVSLKPGTNVAVRIGLSTFTPTQLAENISTVVDAIITKHVAKGGWRNVKAIHIKSPTSTALPIWLADEMWVDEDAILEEDLVKPGQAIEPPPDQKSEKSKSTSKPKRKRNPAAEKGPQAGARKKVRRADRVEGEDDPTAVMERNLDAVRKAKLAKQKKDAFQVEAVTVAVGST